MEEPQQSSENEPTTSSVDSFGEITIPANPLPNPEYWQQSTVSSLSSPSIFDEEEESPSPPTSLLYHHVPILFLVFAILAGILIMPWLAEQIAYSVNHGAERAKADIARKLLEELPSPEQRVPWVVKAVTPCVVGIRTLALGYNGIAMDVGSGVIVDSEGYILTNQHVVANARAIMVRLNNGYEVEAEVVGQDKATDLAILKIHETNLEAITWGDSRQIEVGEQVVAIGNPYNLEQTVTLGIISATERYNPIPSRKRWVQFLQTDAAINPGNSGGALVNLKGELIGINTAIFSETGGNLGIGFAIPSFLAKKVYEEILKYGETQHGFLGLYMEPTPNSHDAKSPRGVVVTGFLTNSPARNAGVEVGDVILRWNETEINDPLQLSHLVILSRPGDIAIVEIRREEKIIKIEITLGARPVEL
jgi:S1-C subfamily serine protease